MAGPLPGAKEFELSISGGGPPVYPNPDLAITNGWRRETPHGYDDPVHPQIGDGMESYNAALSGVEIT